MSFRGGTAVGPPALPGAGTPVETLPGEQLGFPGCHRPSTRRAMPPCPSTFLPQTFLTAPSHYGCGASSRSLRGRVGQAPRWTRDSGLEWAFRLISNPRRLWRRYLIYNTQFLYCLALDRLGLLERDQPLED